MALAASRWRRAYVSLLATFGCISSGELQQRQFTAMFRTHDVSSATIRDLWSDERCRLWLCRRSNVDSSRELRVAPCRDGNEPDAQPYSCRHCQLDATAGTVAGCPTMSRTIHATGSRQRLSATPSGSTTASPSASATSKTSSPNAPSQCRTSPSGTGARPWVRPTHAAPASGGASCDTRHLDELFVTIRGQRQHLWRAVD